MEVKEFINLFSDSVDLNIQVHYYDKKSNSYIVKEIAKSEQILEAFEDYSMDNVYINKIIKSSGLEKGTIDMSIWIHDKLNEG